MASRKPFPLFRGAPFEHNAVQTGHPHGTLMPFKGKVFPKARREFLDGVDFMRPSRLSSVETKMHTGNQMACCSASLLRICGAGLLGRPREWLIFGVRT